MIETLENNNLDGVKEKISKEREKELKEFALGVLPESKTMKAVERKKLDDLLGDMNVVNNLPTDAITTIAIINTIDDLKDKVIRNLNEALDNPKQDIRMSATYQCMKYIFEAKKASKDNKPRTINVSFEGLKIAQPIAPQELKPIEDAEFTEELK